MLSPDDFSHAPTVTISANGLLRDTSFMIDTGAAPNLIKRSLLNPDSKIDANAFILLSGITDNKIKTLGTTDIEYLGHKIKLHVVENKFPISQGGILGSDFLRNATKIDYSKQCVVWQGTAIPFIDQEIVTIPARTRTTFPLRVRNDITEGYVPRINIDTDVYLGDAVVTNRMGKAYIGIINASEKDCEVILPSVEIQEIETYSTTGPTYLNSISSALQSHKSALPKTHSSAESRSRHGSDKPSLGYDTSAPEQTKHIATINGHNRNALPRTEDVKNLLRLEHLNKEETEHVHNLINEHDDLFHLPTNTLQYTNTISHTLPTTDDLPVHTKQYRFPPIHKEEINKQIQDLISNDVIQPSTSPYNSPLWIVPKKPDSKGNKRWRMVIDYRALNEKTVGDAYPLPNIVEILDQLGSAKYFSVFDLASGFHQIPMHESHAHKTAFSTPHGHYEFKRMPFGLKNAPATFQRLMDQVLSGLQGTELFVYLDDIVLYASSLQEHKIKFNKLAERLRKANLKLQPDKCEFLRKEVGYLGHVISDEGVKPDPSKLHAVKEFPRPVHAKNIKQFLGLAGYYRRFIPGFSNVARPLTNLLKKDEPFVWRNEQEAAFTHLRDALCSKPILQYPDFTRQFVVTTDASGYAIGGVLSQGDIGKDLPIAYTSRLLNNAERNYSTIEKELLAIVYCVNHFRPYLYGRKFTLVTDHKPLVWLHSVKDPTSRLVRWRLKLAEYEYDVVYKAGKINANADALSRNPVHPRAPVKLTRRAKQVLPLERTRELSSSEESLFTPKRKETEIILRQTKGEDNNSVSPPSTPSEAEAGDEPNDTRETTSDNSSDSSDDDAIFDNNNEPFVQGNRVGPRIIGIPDNFSTRKDNLVIFTTQQGTPIDRGARMLQENKSLPMIRGAALARASVKHVGKNHVISLIIKERESGVTEKEILKEAFQSLLDVVRELELRSISITKGDIDNVPWNTVYSLLTRVLSETNIKIFICRNEISVPQEKERKDIISENHESAIGGHKGITKTYQRIKKRYNWNGMKADIATFIENCRPCQLKKLVRAKVRQPMILTDTPDAAFDKISMDIMGPLPTTRMDNTYILTIQDLLTKYSLAIPLRQANAIHVADAFTNELICVFGAPKAILTDQGSHFLNSLMRNIANKFKIKHFKTTAYRPQSNGSIERSHHVLWEYLKQYVSKNHEWDKFLKLASFSYNTSVHEGTRYTPYELVFGRMARTPSSNPDVTDVADESYANYLTTLFNKLNDVQAIARENLINAKERSKRYYDRKINIHKFKVGDFAYLLREPQKGKLGDQYSGPFKILEVTKNHNVKLQMSSNKTRIVHQDKLKPSRQRAPTTLGPHSSLSEENNTRTRTEDRPVSSKHQDG